MRTIPKILFNFMIALTGITFFYSLVFSGETEYQDKTELWRYSGYKIGYMTGVRNRKEGYSPKPEVTWEQLTYQKSTFNQLFENTPPQEKQQFQKFFKEVWFDGYKKGLDSISADGESQEMPKMHPEEE